jgi:hypothetical protein
MCETGTYTAHIRHVRTVGSMDAGLLFGNRTECVVSAPDGFAQPMSPHGVQAGFSDTSEPVRIRFKTAKSTLGDLRMDGPS